MSDNSTRVIVTDIKMPFWSMVRFMVKWAIAAIPAILILTILGALLSTAITGFFAHPGGKVVDAAALHGSPVATV